MDPRLKVLNVGQGDCFILNPSDCKYQNYDIFVDVGPKIIEKDVSIYGERNHYILLLSHAHQDHIGGLCHFIFSNGTHSKLKELWLPYHYDDIVFITKMILSLKGIERVSADLYAFHAANDLLATARLLKKLSGELALFVRGLHEGMKICHHITVYNPPLNVHELLGISEEELDRFINDLREENGEYLQRWFHPRIASRIMRLLDVPIENSNVGQSQEEFDDFDEWNLIPPVDNSPTFRRVQFVGGMLYKMRNLLDDFIRNPTNLKFSKIYETVKLSSNDASVVFQYGDQEVSILFTGDVGKKRLQTIVNKNHIRVDVLKIPHHGSKHCMSKTILKTIKPSYAIVSHGNRKFGRSPDPHPHKEVILWLNELKIETLYTNDVEKNDKIIIRKPKPGPFLLSYMSFEDCVG